MTTLCRSDWIQAFGEQELRQAQIDPLRLPVTSFEKIAANSPSVASAESRLSTRASLQNKSILSEHTHD
ncbi:MAG: hypothetical protein ACREO1_01195 [Arenimonas sp.]